MSSRFAGLISILMIVGFQVSAVAQMVPVKDDGSNTSSDSDTGSNQGQSQAQKYFSKRKKQDPPSTSAASTPGDRFLAIHIGTYLDDQAYKWGQDSQHDIGQLNIGMTYKLGEWVHSADFMIRSEFTTYTPAGDTARKLSFLAMITFPDTNSRFPLYFGAGVGPGFYLKQLPGQSAVSADYQLVAGARFLNVFDNLGFFMEFGLKNDIQLFSEGQYNGLFLGAGTAWTF